MGAWGLMALTAGWASIPADMARKTGVGDAEDSDFAGVVWDVFEKPVDGVTGVGGFIDVVLGGVGDNGAVHDELAFGFVATADVGVDEDVAALG